LRAQEVSRQDFKLKYLILLEEL